MVPDSQLESLLEEYKTTNAELLRQIKDNSFTLELDKERQEKAALQQGRAFYYKLYARSLFTQNLINISRRSKSLNRRYLNSRAKLPEADTSLPKRAFSA